MRERRCWMITIMLLVWAALYLVALRAARSYAQEIPTQHTGRNALVSAAQGNVGDGSRSTRPAVSPGPHEGRLIVIGFVGGDVKRDDARHPEVQLAAELRRRYSSSVYAAVFGNHHREAAHRQVLQWLDTDGDGALTPAEKQQARIIIYGHASETVPLAQELGRRKIPVRLTIQMDSVGKPGKRDGLIPPNVANAANFYQPDGHFHGRPEIVAADPARTNIIGNFRMTYNDHPVASSGSSWFARLFIKSHIEIEDDLRIWQEASVLIDAQLSKAGIADQSQVSDESSQAQ